MGFNGEEDIDLLETFCGLNWGRADAKDMAWPFEADEAQVVVWNSMLQQYLYLRDGWHLVRGLHGELWPVDNTTFGEILDPIIQ